MNRLKRWVGPAVLMAALLALAVPAMASASSFGMEQEGKPLPVGTKVTLSATSPVQFTMKYGTYSCESWVFNTELAEDSAGVREIFTTGGVETLKPTTMGFRIVRSGYAQTGECRSASYSFPVPSLIMDEFVLNKKIQKKLPSEQWVGATAPLSMEFQIAGHYCSFASPALPFHYVFGTSTVTLKEAKFPGPLDFCGAESSLSGSFTVSANGKPVILN